MDIILKTDRLILRPLVISDAAAMFDMENNPNVHRYLGNNPVLDIEQCLDYIKNIQNQYVNNGIGRFAVELKSTSQVIGWAGLKFITEPENDHVNFYDIGYRLNEKFWGNGYALEVAKAWLDYGFNQMNIPKMYASANIENQNSIKILKKLGLNIVSNFNWNEIPCHWFELENSNKKMNK